MTEKKESKELTVYKPKPKLGLIIGRFQPFHKGHSLLISTALAECERVLLLLGGSNRAPNHLNPFTYEQRKSLVTQVYKEDERFAVHPLKDNPSDQLWVESVISYVLSATDDIDPTEVTVYTGEKDKEFYEDVLVFTVKALDSAGISGTGIREQIYKRDYLENMSVPVPTKMKLSKLIRTEHMDHMRNEWDLCVRSKATAKLAHAYNNPMEPVAHAVLVHKGNILLVQRNSVRGYGQWAVPGGFVENTETTKQAAIRELNEETGIYLPRVRGAQLAYSVEENLDDIATRTLGVNYLFLVHEDEKLEITLDPEECLGYKWVPIMDICNEKDILFYNHNLVVQRLISMAETHEKETEETK